MTMAWYIVRFVTPKPIESVTDLFFASRVDAEREEQELLNLGWDVSVLPLNVPLSF